MPDGNQTGDNPPTSSIKVHVLHCGRVCVSKYLPFGGEGCSLINGLSEVQGARRILASADELAFASRFPNNAVRYKRRWWANASRAFCHSASSPSQTTTRTQSPT